MVVSLFGERYQATCFDARRSRAPPVDRVRVGRSEPVRDQRRARRREPCATASARHARPSRLGRDAALSRGAAARGEARGCRRGRSSGHWTLPHPPCSRGAGARLALRGRARRVFRPARPLRRVGRGVRRQSRALQLLLPRHAGGDRRSWIAGGRGPRQRLALRPHPRATQDGVRRPSRAAGVGRGLHDSQPRLPGAISRGLGCQRRGSPGRRFT